MTYRQVLEYMYSMLPMFQRIGPQAFKKDLTNTLALCKALEDPQEAFRSVHIAGTNGKGSSSHMIASVLQKAGYKTGLYTSPHLKDFTERIRVNGRPILKSYVIRFIEKIRPHIEEIKPSFFELTVAMAFDYFRQSKVDMAVVETGLGGRFDSTNIITPEVSLITNISFDHQDMLGNTLAEIAFEKAGIIKPGVTVVIGQRRPETDPVFTKKADELSSRVLFAEDLYEVVSKNDAPDQSEYRIKSPGDGNLMLIKSDLSGDYQVKNIPAVLTVLEVLRGKKILVPEKAVKAGLRTVRRSTGLKGRWQILSSNPLIICDVAHNEDGLKWVMDQLGKIRSKELRIVFGMVKDKDPGPILKRLPRNARYYFCAAKIPRARDSKELMAAAKSEGLKGKAYSSVNDAVAAARSDYRNGDVIFIGGSTFVVAEVNELK